MSTVTEFAPVHPRKASASRRRRYLKQLPFHLHQIVPGAATVLVTSVTWEDGDRAELVYHLVVRDFFGTQMPVLRDDTLDIVALLQKAFPSANWARPQTWHWRGNRLSVWRPVQLPAYLRKHS
jgi:hypothetical protein